MDNKLLLVKAITLVFRENQLGLGSIENSNSVVSDVLNTIKVTEVMVEGDFGRDVVGGMRTTLTWMLNHPTDTKFDQKELLQRLRVNVGNEEGLYQALHDGITEEFNDEASREFCALNRGMLREHIRSVHVTEILKQASAQVSFQKENIDWRYFVSDVVNKLEAFKDPNLTFTHSSIVDDFDFSDLDTLRAAMEQGQTELSTEGVLRFGIQAINRMFGSAQGIRRGEMAVIGALQHNFKSGFTNTLLKQVALYNKPFMRDPNKKPMLLRISFENKASDDVFWLYKSLYENETGIEVDIASVNYEDAITYVAEKLQATGYTLKIVRIDPTDFTYQDLFDYIASLEAKGYEIHFMVIDYLNMMSKKGCSMGPHGFETRDLFRRVRNYVAKKGIATVTPHQLSTEAKNLIRQGAENFVQDIANKGYYDSCKTIDQEVDFEAYIHIVIVNGESYLTVQRGKHRKIEVTPLKDLYTVLKFDRIGAIRDDIGKKDSSRRHIGGSTMADGGEAAWYNH